MRILKSLLGGVSTVCFNPLALFPLLSGLCERRSRKGPVAPAQPWLFPGGAGWLWLTWACWCPSARLPPGAPSYFSWLSDACAFKSPCWAGTPPVRALCCLLKPWLLSLPSRPAWCCRWHPGLLSSVPHVLPSWAFLGGMFAAGCPHTNCCCLVTLLALSQLWWGQRDTE